MDTGKFLHLTDAQFELTRKMADAAEEVERIDVFDTYERGLIAHVQGLQAPVPPLLGPRCRARDGCGSHLGRVTSGRFGPIQPGRSGKYLGEEGQYEGGGVVEHLPQDVLLNNMSGCTLYSVLLLVDCYYNMWESVTPLTA
ncbi:Gag protein, partial [Phytophthora palmivora]